MAQATASMLDRAVKLPKTVIYDIAPQIGAETSYPSDDYGKAGKDLPWDEVYDNFMSEIKYHPELLKKYIGEPKRKGDK